MTYRLSSRQSGFSLIEVLVAVLVLSVGLLGMAALMASSMRNNQSANFRTQATNLAYDYIDMMRANITNAPNYARSGYTNPAACNAAQPQFNYGSCGSLHACDRAKWASKLCYTLPNGRGRATVTDLGEGSYDVTVDICWSDDRSADTTPTSTCNGAGETRFVVTSGL